jgi:hypothetical protein
MFSAYIVEYDEEVLFMEKSALKVQVLNLFKCNNAHRFLSKTKNKQSHTIHRDYLGNPEGKNQFL